jgi:pimeloyl-ACP methyl ester carboxylesterase
MKVYFISGLGADERIFKFLSLPDSIEKIYIQWIDPLHGETLQSYSERLLAQIDLSSEVNLVGFSFGGMIAQEMAKIIPMNKLIIVSSIKSETEYNFSFKLLRWFPLYKIVPAKVIKWSNGFTADFFFGVQNKMESNLLHQIIKDTDENFLSWAIEKIFTWKNSMQFQNLIHIHGTKDRIFTYKNIQYAIPIEGGGHFMMVSQAKKVSEVIGKVLSEK